MSNKYILIKVIIFATVLIALLNYVTLMISEPSPENYYEKNEFLHEKLEEDSVDVFFLGASQTGCSISATQIFEETGISSYVLSTSGQPMFSMYFKLKDLFSTGYTPDLIVLDISTFEKDAYFNSLESNEDRFRTGFNILQSMDTKLSYMYELNENFENVDSLEWWIPILYYHNGWKNRELEVNEEYEEWLMGSILNEYSTTSIPVNENYIDESNKEEIELNENAIKYFNKAVELLEEEGIELLVVKYLDATTTNEFNASIEKMCSEKDVTFLNLNKREHVELMQNNFGLDYKVHFYNEKHNNLSGMIIVSSYIAQYVEDEYELKDNRDDPNYDYMVEFYNDFKENFPSAFN